MASASVPIRLREVLGEITPGIAARLEVYLDAGEAGAKTISKIYLEGSYNRPEETVLHLVTPPVVSSPRLIKVEQGIRFKEDGGWELWLHFEKPVQFRLTEIAATHPNKRIVLVIAGEVISLGTAEETVFNGQLGIIRLPNDHLARHIRYKTYQSLKAGM